LFQAVFQALKQRQYFLPLGLCHIVYADCKYLCHIFKKSARACRIKQGLLLWPLQQPLQPLIFILSRENSVTVLPAVSAPSVNFLTIAEISPFLRGLPFNITIFLFKIHLPF